MEYGDEIIGRSVKKRTPEELIKALEEINHKVGSSSVKIEIGGIKCQERSASVYPQKK